MPKVQLSAKEFEMLNDASWFLTKSSIIEKVYLMFGEISEVAKEILKHEAPAVYKLSVHPKISKGENYLGLPYVMLDYPRIFGKENVLAIRIMFWWANYFSITLHLKGNFQRQFVITERMEKLSGYYISIKGDEWAHHIDQDNYQLSDDLQKQYPDELVLPGSFVKIARKIPLTEWDNASAELIKTYMELIRFYQG